jgi:hypothetical protein
MRSAMSLQCAKEHVSRNQRDQITRSYFNIFLIFQLYTSEYELHVAFTEEFVEQAITDKLFKSNNDRKT